MFTNVWNDKLLHPHTLAAYRFTYIHTHKLRYIKHYLQYKAVDLFERNAIIFWSNAYLTMLMSSIIMSEIFLPKTAWAYIVNCCIMRIVTITNFNYFTPKKSIYVELYWNVKYIQYHNSNSFAFWPNHRYSKTLYLDVVAHCIIDLWYPTFIDDSNSRLRSRAGKSKEGEQ